MALPSSGPLSMSQIQGEFGGSNPISLSEYYGEAPGIPSSGTISIDDFYGKSSFVAAGFLSSTTWTVPFTGNYIVYCVGGGAGGSTWNSSANKFYGAGGGSGYLNSPTVSLNAGETLTISVAAAVGGDLNGNSSSVTRGGATLASAGGGKKGVTAGGNGGSGGGGAAKDGYLTGQIGGYHGSNGQANAAPEGTGGRGQTSQSWSNGSNPLIPPGGSSSYQRSIISAAHYDGIYGYGAGPQAKSNQAGQCAGGGGAGAEWGFGPYWGAAGMVVIALV